MAEKVEKTLTGFQLDPRIREKLVPIAVVVIVILGTILFGGRLLGTIIGQQQAVQKERVRLQGLEKKLRQLEETNEIALQQQVKSVENVLPSHKPALNLLLALSRLAQKERVSLSEITINPGKMEELQGESEEIKMERTRKQTVAPRLGEFTLEFSAEGTLVQVEAFIGDLERTAPVVKIEKFSLSLASPKQSAGTTLGFVRVGMTVKIYYQKPPETLGSVEDPLAELTAEETKVANILNEFIIYEAVQPIAPLGKQNLFNSPLSP